MFSWEKAIETTHEQQQVKNAFGLGANTMTWIMWGIQAATSPFLKCWETFLLATISKREQSNFPGKFPQKFLGLTPIGSGPLSFVKMMKLLQCGGSMFQLNASQDSMKKTIFGQWAIPALAAPAQNSTTTGELHSV